jgi:hypothetical protein
MPLRTDHGPSPILQELLALGVLRIANDGSNSVVLPDGTAWSGGGGGSPNFADAEVPVGAIDGANHVYTLVNAPSGASLQLFLNGIMCKAGVDYVLAGNTITYTNAPQAGDSHEAFYRY